MTVIRPIVWLEQGCFPGAIVSSEVRGSPDAKVFDVVRQRLEGVRKKTIEENRLRPALLLCKGEWIEIARCYPKWIRANPHHTTDNPNPKDSDLDKSPRSKGSAYSHKVG